MSQPPRDKSDDVSLTEREQQRKRQLETLISLSGKFGDSLSTAFAKNVAEGKKLDAQNRRVSTRVALLMQSTLMSCSSSFRCTDRGCAATAAAA